MKYIKLDKSVIYVHDKLMEMKKAGKQINKDIIKKLIMDSSTVRKMPGNIYLILGVIKPKGDGIVTCYWCGRKLLTKQSRIDGVGPICIEKYGAIKWEKDLKN